MEKKEEQNNDLLNYYIQTKQRIDLNIDMDSQKIIAQTKLTFLPKNENYNLNKEIPDYLYLYLNGENIYINNIKILKYENNIRKIKEENSISFNEYKNMENLEYNNSSPVGYFKNYLDLLFQNIEEFDSYKNIKRIEWEIRQKGNISIKIPKKYFMKENISKNFKDNNKTIENSLIKLKIIINYILIEKNIGIIFQEYKGNKNNIICYTPNYYYNTQYWVPCIYNLNIQIKWSLYLYIQEDYISYSNCSIIKIIKNDTKKKLIIYKTKEKLIARNLGFLIINGKYYETNINNNFILVYNKNKKANIEKYFINNELIKIINEYYKNFFNINKNKDCSTTIIFVPYLLFNNPYEGFNKFLNLKEDNYFSFIKFPCLYILPEKFIFNKNIPEISKFQLKIISKLFITNYIGSLIIEKTYADFWIINSLEHYLSHLFLNSLFNNNYIKIKLYKWLLKLKNECKKGKEILPLYTNNFSNPMEIQINPILNLKSKIIFHIIESKIGANNIKEILKEIINEKEYISTNKLIDKFKIKHGIILNDFFELYVYRTGMIEVSLSYNYDINNNLFEYNLKMENIANKYYENNPYFSINNIDYEFLNNSGKNLLIIDNRIKPIKIFDINMTLEIFQRDGIEIKKDIYQINSKINHENLSLSSNKRNFELTKIEKEFLDDLIKNTGINKIYKKEEIDKILTKNLILWVKNDSKITSFRINKIKQQHIIYNYIMLFKDDDIFGKFEALYNIGKNKENYEKSLEILKYFIKNSNEMYQIKNYAIKKFIKILIKLKKEDEYLFLIDILDNYYNELLKDKTNINLDNYYLINNIIKYLGEYNEKNFGDILSHNSSVKKKIIDKFLSILTENELDNILGFDNCYFFSNIILICSKLNLGEKSLILLDIILKILRIEKLKRSYNEILIISSLNAFNNLLIKNNFFCITTDVKYKEIISNIFFEINYFINDEQENYELIIILKYFEIFMEFYKCQSYIEFSNYIIKYILGEEYNNIVKMSNFSMNQNLNIISKINAFNFFVLNNNLNFDSFEEKIIFLSSLKILLNSPISYLREDCRYILENIYQIFYKKEISSKGAGNKNFYNKNFLHLYNKNRINFSSKKYADYDYLFSSINEINSSIKIKEKIEEYNKKYKNNCNDIFNIEINIKKSFEEIICNIFNKLIVYSNSKNFLGDLYEKDNNIISKNLDFNDIKYKILNKYYINIDKFNEELNLLFKNYKSTKEKEEINYKIIQLKEYYQIIIFKYKDIIIFKEKENNKMRNDNQEKIETINNDDKTKNYLNKKRNIRKNIKYDEL